MYLIKAIVIAIRHSASRKQFGPTDNGDEIPVLEYQSQVQRIIFFIVLWELVYDFLF